LKKNEENEGYNESKKLKENNEWIRYKKTRGKLIFLWEELPSRKCKREKVIVIQEIL